MFRRKPSGCHRGAQSGDQIDRDFLNLAETLEFDPILETDRPPEKTREHALLIRPLRGQIKEFRAYLAAAGLLVLGASL